MGLQIFGTRKCQETKKAQRFFSDRQIPFQFIDLEEKGISPGELRSVIASVGIEGALDREGRRFKERGMAYMEFDAEAEMLADPALIRTPIVRDGAKAVCGRDPEAWAALAKGR